MRCQESILVVGEIGGATRQRISPRTTRPAGVHVGLCLLSLRRRQFAIQKKQESFLGQMALAQERLA